MSISASQVKELREMSGVGMMECKNALVETDGDIEKAMDLLRANSSLKAEKKASRVAADGEIKVVESKEFSCLIEINSETDFAAKDSKFKDFANDVAEYLLYNEVNNIDDLSKVFEEKRQSLIQSIGENIQLRRLVTIEAPSTGVIGAYLHSDGKLAALVSIDSKNIELAKDLAMHVSATNPSCLNPEDIDIDLLEREKSIFKAQAKESGKDDHIMEKIVLGKINRFLSEASLISQAFVKNPDQSINDLLNENKTSILAYARFKVGEGIEVEAKDFASEVAEQLK
tara:strand:- start:15939 stop:16793 length:855 start_codon:yes stop_codon:yes gene_type:complete